MSDSGSRNLEFRKAAVKRAHLRVEVLPPPQICRGEPHYAEPIRGRLSSADSAPATTKTAPRLRYEPRSRPFPGQAVKTCAGLSPAIRSLIWFDASFWCSPVTRQAEVPKTPTPAPHPAQPCSNRLRRSRSVHGRAAVLRRASNPRAPWCRQSAPAPPWRCSATDGCSAEPRACLGLSSARSVWFEAGSLLAPSGAGGRLMAEC